MRPDVLLFVFDRCADNSVEIISNIVTDLQVTYVVKTIGENFSAGMTRDYGLDALDKSEEFNSYDVVLFTDGDCIPSEDLIKHHLDNLSRTDKHSVSCGPRTMQDEFGNDKLDERFDWADGCGFTNRNARLIVSKKLTVDSILTYSCNLAFNKAAIDICRQINKELSNSARVFNPEFDGSWGGEDNFISHCIFKTNGNILLTCKDAVVYHPYHVESDKKNVNEKTIILRELTRRLTNVIDDRTICGEISEIEQFRPISYSGFTDIIKNIKTITKVNLPTTDAIDPVVFDYMMARNTKYVISKNPSASTRTLPNHILIYQVLQCSYMKYYLEPDDTIIFVDDLKDMKLKDNSRNPHDYGSLDK